jgi:hypothetical protein
VKELNSSANIFSEIERVDSGDLSQGCSLSPNFYFTVPLNVKGVLAHNEGDGITISVFALS